MASSARFAWRRVCRSLVLLALPVVVATYSGCSTGSWQRYEQSPANPMVWFRALLPPDGETFYSDQAQEIDRSLRRE